VIVTLTYHSHKPTDLIQHVLTDGKFSIVSAAVPTVINFVIVVISPMPHSMATNISDIKKQSQLLP
jgi:hypothetical protein